MAFAVFALAVVVVECVAECVVEDSVSLLAGADASVCAMASRIMPRQSRLQRQRRIGSAEYILHNFPCRDAVCRLSFATTPGQAPSLHDPHQKNIRLDGLTLMVP